MRVSIGRFCITVCLIALATSSLQAGNAANCGKWDYRDNPVVVTDLSGKPSYIAGLVNGYPSSLSQPQIPDAWQQDPPQQGAPVQFVIDYGKPVMVTRFIHYFDRFPNSHAWEDISIDCSNDQAIWRFLTHFRQQLSDAPQVLSIGTPATARYYKFSILSMHPGGNKLKNNMEDHYKYVCPVTKTMPDGSPRIISYELETYTGTIIGNIQPKKAIVHQSEPCKLQLWLLSPQKDVSGLSVRITAPKGACSPIKDVPVPLISKISGAFAEINLVPRAAGPMPLIIELWQGGKRVDRIPYTLQVQPSLQMSNLSAFGTISAQSGKVMEISGRLTNISNRMASNARVQWLGSTISVGKLLPHKSASFKLRAVAKAGFDEGLLTASADGNVRTLVRRPVICPSGCTKSRVDSAKTEFGSINGAISITCASVKSNLTVSANDKPIKLVQTGSASAPLFAAAVPGGALVLSFAGEDLASMRCKVVPCEVNSSENVLLHLEMRLAVGDAQVMFRPQVDWYRKTEGPNFPHLVSGHNSATRMMSIQTGSDTISLVPSHDNLVWGFDKDNKMQLEFDIPMRQHDPLHQGIWRGIQESPSEFTVAMPVTKGDCWDAYRYVVKRIFGFSEPKQYAMPITQMQMLSARYIAKDYALWSERWQMVRSYPNQDIFYNFYGSPYLLPTLYGWYLATDDATALAKTGKVIDWILKLQMTEAPFDGAWFSQYGTAGAPAVDQTELVGRDQAGNRYVLPHATGASASSLLYYWEASGKNESRVLESAKRGCDWLLKNQRSDGSWPYAFDLTGNPVTTYRTAYEYWPYGGWGRPYDSTAMRAGKPSQDNSDAGQIWCARALWQIFKATGDIRYKQAALKFKEFFKSTYMDQHRYQGYWEDVTGFGGLSFSWEGYEASVAAVTFADMGDAKLAVEAAKDAATWIWTRVISTRRYETCYGQTTEQSLCGPSQAQTPMAAMGFMRAYELTGDSFWHDYAGAMKSINFVAEPTAAYGMTDAGGWTTPLWAVSANAYENFRQTGAGAPGIWTSAQFSSLALEWLIREGNLRAPKLISINPVTFRGKVFGDNGRVRMPEEKIDINAFEHNDINWTGYENSKKYYLLLMNHQGKVQVAIRPHEAHLVVFTRLPKLLIGGSKGYQAAKITKQGTQIIVNIPARSSAILAWDRIK